MEECRQTSKNAAHCACGGMMYEDAAEALYCVISGKLLFKPSKNANQWSVEPHHVASCHRDDEGHWHCKQHCPVQKMQMGMFA